MNYQNWSKKAFYSVLALAVFLGFLIAPDQGAYDGAEVRQKNEELAQMKQELDKRDKELATWKEVKDVDDEAFLLSADVITMCSDVFTAVGDGDMTQLSTTLDRVNTQLPDKTNRLTEIRLERLGLLDRLGY